MRVDERSQNQRTRDVFDWLSVVVDAVQAVMFVVGGVAALYWFVLRGGGMPAVIVSLVVAVAALLCCAVWVLLMLRYPREHGRFTGRRPRTLRKR